MDLKFKRQKPMGHYIVDFVCVERRLIIELDGGQHAEQTVHDQHRDAWLRSEGYTVLRFWNNDVMQNVEGVFEQIRCTLALSPALALSSILSRKRERRRSIPLPLGEGLGEGSPQVGEGN